MIKLTKREEEIIQKICSGASNNEIAKDLCITIHTIKSHISSIFKKLGARNRTNASYIYAKYFENE